MFSFQRRARLAIRLTKCKTPRQAASTSARVRGHPEASERITLSIGVAGWHAGESGAEWYARADAALYEAKRRGRNRVSIARILELEF
jgi:diguanylate cyclase (GGDEF)-like protein